jgi:hypothetical protein
MQPALEWVLGTYANQSWILNGKWAFNFSKAENDAQSSSPPEGYWSIVGIWALEPGVKKIILYPSDYRANYCCPYAFDLHAPIDIVSLQEAFKDISFDPAARMQHPKHSHPVDVDDVCRGSGEIPPGPIVVTQELCDLPSESYDERSWGS